MARLTIVFLHAGAWKSWYPPKALTAGTRWDFLTGQEVLIRIIVVGEELTSRSMSLPWRTRKPEHISPYPHSNQDVKSFAIFCWSKHFQWPESVTVFRHFTFRLPQPSSPSSCPFKEIRNLLSHGMEISLIFLQMVEPFIGQYGNKNRL